MGSLRFGVTPDAMPREMPTTARMHPAPSSESTAVLRTTGAIGRKIATAVLEESYGIGFPGSSLGRRRRQRWQRRIHPWRRQTWRRTTKRRPHGFSSRGSSQTKVPVKLYIMSMRFCCSHCAAYSADREFSRYMTLPPNFLRLLHRSLYACRHIL